jgi:hypothetical protein
MKAEAEIHSNYTEVTSVIEQRNDMLPDANDWKVLADLL